MTTATVAAFRNDTALRQLGADTRYVLTGFPIGILTFAGAVAGLALGAGTAVLVVGVPILAGTLAAASRVAAAERRRAARVLGRPVPAPYPARRGSRLASAEAWRALAYALVRFVPNTVASGLVVTWWAAAIGGLSTALWDWAIPYEPRYEGLPALIGLGSATETRIWFFTACGLFFALTLMPLVRSMARMEASFAEFALSSRMGAS
ncbi:sensor domain-containing protein [Catenuloplanes atrovinosus]|uniref:Putative sensor domain-containing protein n=1 Tax=Catenuloplanes atrovinosus TaxID=137266 RepID=A0AAE4C949_9ACTN|nr:sensor domain-containing protein [Catenuloplanes atrovinosus]MDR7274454.1 hypothetical protein [Catenuloplanes atrovinosus]